MLDRDVRATVDRHEPNLGQHIVERAREREAHAGLPRRDARPFEMRARRIVEHLEDAAADA